MRLAQPRQSREEWQTGVGGLQAFVEVDLLERFHAAGNLEAPINHLRQPGIVILDGKPSDVFSRRVACVAAVQAGQALQPRAFADMTEAVVLQTDGCQPRARALHSHTAEPPVNS